MIAKQAMNKIIEILDITEQKDICNILDEAAAYRAICDIINEYQQEQIKKLIQKKKRG